MTKIITNIVEVNTETKEVESKNLVKLGLSLDKYQSKSNKVTFEMGVSLSVIARAIGKKNNNAIPETSVLRKELKSILEGGISDENTVERIMKNSSNIISVARCLLLEDTSLIVGFHKEDSSIFISSDKATNKDGSVKNGYIQDLFYKPSNLFPKEKIAGSKDGTRPSIDSNQIAKMLNIRDLEKRYFLDKKLNSQQTGFDADTRKDQDKSYSLNTREDFKIALTEMIKKVKNLDVLLEGQKGQEIYSLANGLFSVMDKEIKNRHTEEEFSKINSQVLADEKRIEKTSFVA
mgnify:FL=1